MKKYILLLSVFCLGLVSCVKENFAGAEADGLVTFTASYTGASQSKTALVGLTPYWTPGEKISIYDGKNNEFTNDLTTTAAPTAQFKGKLEGQGLARKDFLAAAPYNPDYTFSFVGNYVSGMMLPAEQTAVENGYDPAAAPAIAYTSNTNLSFKNAFSLVKFTVISDGVTSVTISGKNSEVLAGTLNVAYSEQELRIIATKKETSVTLKGDFKKESVYYISTLPATLKNGLTVTLNGSVQSLSLDFQVALGRSGLVDLGKLSLNPGESQLPDSGDEEDEGVPSGWVIIGQFCSWADDGALATYDMGSYYKAFDVPAASLSSFKFKNGDVWLGMGGDAVAADKWVTLSQDGAASDIAFSGTATAYDVYLDKELRGFYVTEAGNPSPEPIPAPYVGKSVAGNFNTWNASANPMTEEGDYYVVKGLQLASTNLADPTSNGFKFVDSKGADQSTWYGVGTSSVELGKWYATKVDGSLNICINGDATALYDAYIAMDMSTFCVVAAGSEIPSKDEVGDETVETAGTVYLKPNANWKEAGARFAAYFFEGDANTWMSMTDADGDGVYECGVPVGYSNVIFTRMNPANSDNKWDNKWNQTADLKVPTDGTNLYTITDGSWDAGSWSTHNAGNVNPTPDPTPDPDPTPEPDPTPDPTPGTGGEGAEKVRIYLSTAWGWPYLWCWDAAGNQIFTGALWPGTKYHGEENGYYYWDVPEAYVGKTVSLLAVKDEQASEQTSDFNNVVLDKSVYFYLDWTQELGCHLIQENK